MSLFFNGIKLAKNTDTVSGGVNLLVNTDRMTHFNNLGNKGDSTGYSIDDKASYTEDLNAKEIKTNVFHAFGSTLTKAPVALAQDVYLPAGTWTLSFLGRNNGNKSSNDTPKTNTVSLFSDWSDSHDNAPLGTSDLMDNVWKLHKITFTTSEGMLHKNIRIVNNTNNGIAGGSLFFANFKLEAGSQATTYCPSYQDILAEIKAIKTTMGGVIANTIRHLFSYTEVA